MQKKKIYVYISEFLINVFQNIIAFIQEKITIATYQIQRKVLPLLHAKTPAARRCYIFKCLKLLQKF